MLLIHGKPYLRLRRSCHEKTEMISVRVCVLSPWPLGVVVWDFVHAVSVSVPMLFVLRWLTIVPIYNLLCRIGSSTFKVTYSRPCSSVPNTTLEKTTFRYTRLDWEVNHAAVTVGTMCELSNVLIVPLRSQEIYGRFGIRWVLKGCTDLEQGSDLNVS
jgi:hypothetical protein